MLDRDTGTCPPAYGQRRWRPERVLTEEDLVGVEPLVGVRLHDKVSEMTCRASGTVGEDHDEAKGTNSCATELSQSGGR
jgi:hypothetical protein